jgi:hypothetical protein
MTKHDKSEYVVMIQIHFKIYMTGHNINMREYIYIYIYIYIFIETNVENSD